MPCERVEQKEDNYERAAGRSCTYCAQCEEHAECLLPDVSLIKTRMPKGELVGARQEINPLEDPALLSKKPMAKFNGLTLASNSALRALLAGPRAGYL